MYFSRKPCQNTNMEFALQTMNKTRFLFIFLGAAVLALADQISKYFILNNFGDYAIFNTGTAFGIKMPLPVLLIGIPVLLMLGLAAFYLYFDLGNKFIFIMAMLMLGGGIGNYIDRIWHGYVIDFIDVGFWPAFNLADTFLVCGVMGLMLKFLYDNKK